MDQSTPRIMSTLQMMLSQAGKELTKRQEPANLERWAPRTDWHETVGEDEPAYFQSLVAEINAMQMKEADATKRPVDRGFHAKSHTVLRGELTVAEGIPAPLRQGVFRDVRTFQAWVRLSNGHGAHQADRTPDIRGMAVKILNVPGTPLSPPHDCLDLITILQAAQPARDIYQFMAFIRAMQNPLTLPIRLPREIGVLETARMLAWAAVHLSKRTHSLVTHDYFSAVPIAWGPYAAKYSWRPVGMAPARRPRSADPDYLRYDLVDRLKKGDLRWDLMVQLYTDPKKTPIEDASVEWKVEDSPFVKVAELVVRRRDLTSPTAVVEQAEGNTLSFSPWHAPQEHRPLGSIMRARRAVYEASARLRWAGAAAAARDVPAAKVPARQLQQATTSASLDSGLISDVTA